MSNPIFAFSARRRMRTVRTAILLTLYGLAVLLFGIAVGFHNFTYDTLGLSDMRSGVDGYAFMLMFQFVLLILVTPALTAGSISGERERQTLELLLVTNTGSFRIVMGKLMESFGMVLLLLISTLPAMCLPLLTGGVSFLQILEGLLFLAVAAFACLSVGMIASAVFRRTVAATVVAYLAVFAIGILTLLPLIGDIFSVNEYYSAQYSSGTVAVIGGADGPTSLIMGNDKLVLWGFVFNPALGLVTLIADQTGLLKDTLSSFFYEVRELYEKLDFSLMKWLSMAFMFVAGLSLDLLAACFVRPRKARVRKGKKK